MRKAPRVLLVTGAYHPEISAAAVQSRAVAAALGDRVRFSVLATAVDRALPLADTVDGVAVRRIPIDVRSRRSAVAASARTAAQFAAAGGDFDLVHLHGVSRKNVPVTALARLFGKPIVLHLHTAGQDEPAHAGRAGALGPWAFRQAARVLAVSRSLVERAVAGGVDPSRVRFAPNGVDTARFAPIGGADRGRVRAELGIPADARVTLFVGFFSREKRPDVLFRAWRAGAARDPRARLVFVGATVPTYYEIDGGLADSIRRDATAADLADRVAFANPTNAVERYMAAADLFALTSAREAMPLALLEAMASGLACIASRLPGSTDTLIDDGVSGRLIDPDDEAGWTAALSALTSDAAAAAALGRCARARAVDRFGIAGSAAIWLDTYDELMRKRQ